MIREKPFSPGELPGRALPGKVWISSIVNELTMSLHTRNVTDPVVTVVRSNGCCQAGTVHGSVATIGILQKVGVPG